MKHLRSVVRRINRQLSHLVEALSRKLKNTRHKACAFIAAALLIMASQMSLALESMDDDNWLADSPKADNNVKADSNVKAESNLKSGNKAAKNTSEEDALDLDDIKIKLIAKGSLKKQRLASKKIKGPNKLLLQQKIAAELKSTPESINAADLDILDLQLEAPTAAISLGESDAAFTTQKSE